jgi:hypothetical protein
MFGRIVTNTAKHRLVKIRILEALREVGILVIAFAPLDVVMDTAPLEVTWKRLTGSMVVGFLLFASGVIGEWRLDDG